MDSKHDKNKQLRPQEDRHLPPELQWENMEAGILQKMEKLQVAAPAAPVKRQRKWGLIGLLLFLGGLISAIILFDSKPAAVSTADALSQSSASAEAINDSDLNEVRNTVHRPVTMGKQASEKELTHTQAGVIQHYEIQLGTDSRKQYYSDELTVEKGDPGSTLENLTQSSRTATPVQQFLFTDKPLPQGRIERDGETRQITTGGTRNDAFVSEGERKTDAIAHIVWSAPSNLVVNSLPADDAIDSVTSQEGTEAANSSVPELVVIESLPTRIDFSSQIWLMGGASWWNPGYGSTKPERAALEQAVLSYQGQFSYVKPLNSGMTLLAGVQYQQLESRLNWNTQIEDYEIVLEDTIVQVQTNVITGERTEIRGDVSLIVPAERRVQHYNSLSLLQIPVSIGKSWGAKRWQSHLMVGGVANISFSKTGRTLYQNELVDYNDSSTGIWSNKLGFSATLSAGLSYRITDDLGIVTMLQYQRSLSNWSTEENTTMQPHILNWSFGASYSL